jgi:hypothetical protein
MIATAPGIVIRSLTVAAARLRTATLSSGTTNSSGTTKRTTIAAPPAAAIVVRMLTMPYKRTWIRENL